MGMERLTKQAQAGQPREKTFKNGHTPATWGKQFTSKNYFYYNCETGMPDA